MVNKLIVNKLGRPQISSFFFDNAKVQKFRGTTMTYTSWKYIF